MKEIILSLASGIAVGVVFRFAKLPLPAPPVLAGLMGILGIFLGGKLADFLL